MDALRCVFENLRGCMIAMPTAVSATEQRWTFHSWQHLFSDDGLHNSVLTS
jgi:hypothetical protein